MTHIEAFFSQKYALFSNHCPLLPNCFLRLKGDNNRSVAAFTLVSRAAGKLDVRAGCVCGERWAVCGQLSPTSATCPPWPCRCPRTQQRLPRLQQHTGDALEILYTLYYPRCLAFIHWYIFLYLRLHTFAITQEGSAQAAVHRLSEDQEEECKCFLGAVKVVQPSPGREM